MDYALPVGFAIAAWWLSTVILIYRAGLPRASFAKTLAATTAVMLLGVAALLASRSADSASGAYVAFLGALAIWGWHEVTYLFGFISGPRPEACPPNCRGWRRFVLGVKTCVYHELAIVATAAAMAAVFWEAPNRVGLWTFLILWLMRWSVKLNIFLGVRNLHEEFWPDHLQYLKTFVRRRRMNELFPISIIAASSCLALLVFVAIGAGDNGAERTGATLLATLMALAILEHWLLVLRISDGPLWSPGMRSRRNRGAEAG